ncbi:hypothetical protein ABPG72_015126 [Tetrahymena utriculariae]
MNISNQFLFQQQAAIQDFSQLIKSIDFTELKSLTFLDDFHAKIYKHSQEWLQKFPIFSDWIVAENVKEIPLENKWFFVSEQEYPQRKLLQTKLKLKMASDSNSSPCWTLFDIKSYTKNSFIVRIIKLKNKYSEQRYYIQQLKKHYLVYTINQELAINNQYISDAKPINQFMHNFCQPDYVSQEMSEEQQKNFIDYQQGKQNQQNNFLQRTPQNSLIKQSPMQEMNLQRAGQIEIVDDCIDLYQEDSGRQEYNNKIQNSNYILINNQPNIQNTNRQQNINVNSTNMTEENEIPTFKNKNIQQQPIINTFKDNMINQNTVNQSIFNHNQNQNIFNQQQNNYQMNQNLNNNGNIAGGFIDHNKIDHFKDNSPQEIQGQIKIDQKQNIVIDQKYNNIRDFVKENIIVLELLNNKDETIAKKKNKLMQKSQLIEQQDLKIKLLNESIAEKDNKIQILEEQIILLQTQLQQQQNLLGQGLEEHIDNLLQRKEEFEKIAQRQKDEIDKCDNKIKMLLEKNEELIKERECFQQEIFNREQQQSQNIQTIQNLQQQIKNIQNELNILQNKSQKDLLKLKNKYEIKNKRYKLYKKTNWLIKHQEKISQAHQETQTEPSNYIEMIIKDEPITKIYDEEEENNDAGQNEVESSQMIDINEKKEEKEQPAQEQKKQEEGEEELQQQQQFEQEFQEDEEVYQINGQQEKQKKYTNNLKDIKNLSTILDQQIPQQNHQAEQQMSVQFAQLNQMCKIIQEPNNYEDLSDQYIQQNYSYLLNVEGVSEDDLIEEIRKNLQQEKKKQQMQEDQQIAKNLQIAKENV